MNYLRKLKPILVYSGTRHLTGPKRKYPINTTLADQLPIFEGKTSKRAYKRVFSWGNAQTGALGIIKLLEKKTVALKFPKRVGFGEAFEVVTAAAGFGFSAFGVNSDTDVKLYGCGINTDSQIGYHERRTGHPLGLIFQPRPISLPFTNPRKTRVLKLAAGRAHLVVLTDEGLYTLGNNAYGQCGRTVIPNEDYIKSNHINHIETVHGKRIIDIECGQDHTLALAEDGSVFSCGWGADGQTGLGHFKNTDRFEKVKGDIVGEKIIKLSSRSDFVLALSDRGEVFGWGNNEYGQISLENDEQQLSNPVHLKNISKLGKMTNVASGGCSCLVVNQVGEVFSWGYGLLGLGPNVALSKEPLKIPETLFGQNDFSPNTKVVKIKCGLNYFAAITNTGDLYMWGRNRGCALGFGDEKDQFFPLKVAIGGIVENVFCGLDHTIALCKPFI
ncbi:RCC1-like G exchanging factor-like protein [Anthonomus grandis grandis]|uniref:RCC1-like G exchanging factor-like protein n=1 Tax=Anthonomus grandis grandis TaxID=2921223 RepID=UPI002166137F|nr:RCC1-like G exchanging factor-like protein [Anthonomus grandis grandis]